MIYIFRDTMVSYYYHHKLIKAHGFSGNLQDFAKRFMNDELMYSPYWEHLKVCLVMG